MRQRRLERSIVLVSSCLYTSCIIMIIIVIISSSRTMTMIIILVLVCVSIVVVIILIIIIISSSLAFILRRLEWNATLYISPSITHTYIYIYILCIYIYIYIHVATIQYVHICICSVVPTLRVMPFAAAGTPVHRATYSKVYYIISYHIILYDTIL